MNRTQITEAKMKITKSKIYKFNTPAMANSFAADADVLKMAVLGDDELIWVVTPADWTRLIRGGYEDMPLFS
jgi:hypothetical protein